MTSAVCTAIQKGDVKNILKTINQNWLWSIFRGIFPQQIISHFGHHLGYFSHQFVATSQVTIWAKDTRFWPSDRFLRIVKILVFISLLLKFFKNYCKFILKTCFQLIWTKDTRFLPSNRFLRVAKIYVCMVNKYRDS